MTNIKLIVNGAKARAEVDGILTSGMVGIPVTIVYDGAWKGLAKNLVCSSRRRYDPPDAGTAQIVANVDTAATVAHEVMEAGRYLYLGITGYDADGSLVMPTTWAECGMIYPGAHADDEASADPTLPVWAQLEADVAQLKYDAVTDEKIAKAVADYMEENPVDVPDSSQNTGSAVCYTAQTLTDEQKAQARENIGAIDVEDVLTLFNDEAADMDLLEGVASEAGYLQVDGKVYDSGNVTTLERTYDYVPVNSGKEYVFSVDWPSDVAGEVQVWIAYGFFRSADLSGFETRTVCSEGTAMDDGSLHAETAFTVPDGVSYVRVTGRTYGNAVFKLMTTGTAGGLLPRIDPTLSQEGSAADAKAVGDALTRLGDYAEKIPEIVGTSVGGKATVFSGLMHGTDAVESFLFFADPHFLNSIDNEAQMREYMDTLKLYYDVTPTSFVVSGGDWYGSKDTYESACFKLGYIDGWMRKLFGHDYYPALGNHDTNQQGVDETGGTWTGILPKETVRNLWFREQGNTYYAFDGTSTRFYVLDSWKEGTDAAYYWEQIAWLGEKLKADDPGNAALVLHIGYYPSGESYVVDTLAKNALALSEAFNNAAAITLNGTAYDFAGCTGKVRFALSGHIHIDRAVIVNGIPLIATTHMRDGDIPTFELCLADYDANTLHLIRVGTGVDRKFTMGPNGAVLDGTEGDMPEEDTDQLTTITVADPIVFLTQTNHNGGGLAYSPNQPTRAVIVTTDNTGIAFTASVGTTDVTHYALVIPVGSNNITVKCGDALQWCIDYVKETGQKVDGSAQWNDSGVTEAISSESLGYYLLKFRKPDESEFTTNYDGSHITWTFA